jgi:hypothetical protein
MTHAIWLVEHPLYRYAEDVKALARRAGLTVIDSAYASDEDRAEAVDPKAAPRLTVRPEFAPAKRAAKAGAEE